MSLNDTLYPCCISLGGIPVRFNCFSSATLSVFDMYMPRAECTEPVLTITGNAEIAGNKHKEDSRFVFTDEFVSFILPTSNALLAFKRCLFHGTAFSWNDKAYIFVGPSGAGKSTQYRNWRKLFHDEIHILNGDKPLLEWKKDNEFWIHPSPWRGKEEYGRQESARLAGLIYVSQDSDNEIRRLKPEEGVTFIYRQFIYEPTDVNLIQKVCSMEDALLRSVPLWHLKNRADEEAVLMTRDAILKYEGNRKDEI